MKTIEEAAKECAFSAIGNKTHFTDERIFQYGVEFAQRWIPIDEELPEIGESVIIKNAGGFVGIGEWAGKRWSRWIWYSCESTVSVTQYYSKEVTHWRPIDLKEWK